jgi:hypothetical protein
MGAARPDVALMPGSLPARVPAAPGLAAARPTFGHAPCALLPMRRGTSTPSPSPLHSLLALLAGAKHGHRAPTFQSRARCRCRSRSSMHPPASSKAEHRAAIAHACGRSRRCPCASPSPAEPSSATACRIPCCGRTWLGRHGPPSASPSAPTGAGGHVGARAAFPRRRSPPVHRHRRRGHH